MSRHLASPEPLVESTESPDQVVDLFEKIADQRDYHKLGLTVMTAKNTVYAVLDLEIQMPVENDIFSDDSAESDDEDYRPRRCSNGGFEASRKRSRSSHHQGPFQKRPRDICPWRQSNRETCRLWFAPTASTVPGQWKPVPGNPSIKYSLNGVMREPSWLWSWLRGGAGGPNGLHSSAFRHFSLGYFFNQPSELIGRLNRVIRLCQAQLADPVERQQFLDADVAIGYAAEVEWLSVQDSGIASEFMPSNRDVFSDVAAQVILARRDAGIESSIDGDSDGSDDGSSAGSPERAGDGPDSDDEMDGYSFAESATSLSRSHLWQQANILGSEIIEIDNLDGEPANVGDEAKVSPESGHTVKTAVGARAEAMVNADAPTIQGGDNRNFSWLW